MSVYREQLTFQKAWEIARSMETAGKNVAAVQKELVKEDETRQESAPQLKESGQGSGRSTLARRNLHCQRCGGTNHTPSNCRFKNTECFVCKTRGHIAKVCRARTSTRIKSAKKHHVPQQTKMVHKEEFLETEDEIEENTYYVKKTVPGRVEPIWVLVEASGKVLNMEVDTGASVSLISKETYRRTWRGRTTPTLKTTKKRLKTYTGDTIQVVGEIQVKVGVHNTGQKVKLPLLVVKGGIQFIGQGLAAAVEIRLALDF